jgi:membrane peptidoglycan carboxypeptidase
MVLGASTASSWQVASAYAAFANGGTRVPLHGLARVVDRRGEVLERPLETHEAMSERTAFLVTSLLQGVVERGTAGSVRSLGLEDPVAGKTGTSNQGRDGWFAGYSAERATVVWVGYDDNLPTRLSGTRGALPLWTRFSLEVRPPAGYAQAPPPDGVAEVWVDPQTGGLATASCPARIREYLPAGEVFAASCALHVDPPAGSLVTIGLEAPGAEPGATAAGERLEEVSSHSKTPAGEAPVLARVAVASSLEAIGFRSRNARLALAAAGAPSGGWSGTVGAAAPGRLASPTSGPPRLVTFDHAASPGAALPYDTEVVVLDGPRGRRVEVVRAPGNAPRIE